METLNKKNKFYLFIVIAFFVFVFAFYGYLSKKNNLMFDYFSELKIAGKNISVLEATTPEERKRGLSGVKNLEESWGMLFVFEDSGIYSFWMKDMNFPIDIIWIDENSKVVYIKKYAQPESYPEVFTPNVDSKYVLEVVAGFSDKYNIKIGDNVESYFLNN
jgi:hypothetical protein